MGVGREDPKRGSSSHFQKHKRKDGKGFTKRVFLGRRNSTVSEGEREEGAGNTEQAGNWSIVKNTVNQEEWDRWPVGSSDDGGSDSERRGGERKGERGGERGGGNKHTEMEEEEEPSATPLLEEEESDNSWMCPLTSDELSLSPSNTELASTLLSMPSYESERESTPSYKTPSSGSGSASSQGLRTKSQSGMILKLRRVLFPKGSKGQQTRYQAVSVSDPELHRHSQPLLSDSQPLLSDSQPLLSDSQPLLSDSQPLLSDSQPPLSDSQPLLSETEDGESGDGEARRERDREGDRGEARERTRDGGLSRKMSSQLPQRGLRFQGFSSPLRPLCHLTTFSSFSRLSSALRRSVMKIKYCPFLSACHSSDHRRRRWILRSAVQRARRVMKIYYPDLVGRRIQHLYEEGDGTEVWYRGLVEQVHEAHPNPLKTVFQVKYDSEPEWQYYLELLIDYKKGWLKIEG